MEDNVLWKIILKSGIIIGIICIISGLFIKKSAMDFKKSAQTVNAKITNIVEYKKYKKSLDGKRRDYNQKNYDTRNKVYIEFLIDNNKISGPLKSYNSKMKVGDEILIYYNPNNPQEFIAENDDFNGTFTIIVGCVFLILSNKFTIRKIKKYMSKDKIIANGDKIYAEIDRIEIDTNCTVNGKHPFVIICKSNNPEVVEYRSINFWNDPTQIIKERKITNFPVYIDTKNPKKYFVLTEEIDKYVND